MRNSLLLGCALLVALIGSTVWSQAPHAAEAQDKTSKVEIPTERGVKLEGVLHAPAEPNGVAVVFGSGRGYHMDLPLLVRSAEELQKRGVTALRFNWAYFTAKAKYSEGLVTEMKDLDAALAYAKGLDGVKHVVLAGKSLGSIAAFMRATAKSDDLAGLILMTFPIHPQEKPGEIFEDQKKLYSWKKPLMIVCGDADPYSSVKSLYTYCAGFEQAPRLVLAPGDHSFKGSDRENAEETGRDIDLAAHGLARWVALWSKALKEVK
jgi:predicted alpha/beta-hydrolase family hydrolase